MSSAPYPSTYFSLLQRSINSRNTFVYWDCGITCFETIFDFQDIDFLNDRRRNRVITMATTLIIIATMKARV